MSEGSVWWWLGALAGGYLIGSVSPGYLAGRWLAGVDIRRVGNANPGAANVGRVVGPGVGLAVFLADLAKGVAPVSLARALGSDEPAWLLAGLGAIAGNNWPLWHGFAGGIGGATCLGVILALMPGPTLVAGGLGVAFLLLGRHPGLAQALVLVIAGPIGFFVGESPGLFLGYYPLAVVVGLRAWYWPRVERRRLGGR